MLTTERVENVRRLLSAFGPVSNIVRPIKARFDYSSTDLPIFVSAYRSLFFANLRRLIWKNFANIRYGQIKGAR